jgi:TrmH family RNA methyltransferase
MGLSKNQLKLITSLVQKKYRTKNNLFIAEGRKVVSECLHSNFRLEHLYCVDNSDYKNLENVTLISTAELKKMSSLSTPNNVLALFEIPEKDSFVKEGLILALDDIMDPGNLGTIIRLCDWFGVDQLICSMNSVDCYNSKVVQASMGSIARVSIVYTDLKHFLRRHELPKYAAIMKGENVFNMELPKNAILIMGNEANGIHNDVLGLSNNTVSIPRFGKSQNPESLNVASATAILLSEFSRLT